MNTYILAPLLMASALIPVVSAWAVSRMHNSVKIVLWFIWAVTASAGFGLWYYAAHTTKMFHGDGDIWLWVAGIGNVIMFLRALDSPFAPSMPKTEKPAVKHSDDAAGSSKTDH